MASNALEVANEPVQPAVNTHPIEWGKIGEGIKNVGEAIGPWLPLAGAVYGHFESRRAERVQQAREDSAHQREVQDLLKAGINPALRGLQGAESSPGVRGNAVQEALAVAQARANIVLTRSAAYKNTMEAEYTDRLSQDLGEGGQVRQQREVNLDISRFDLEQRRALANYVVEEMKVRIREMSSAAERNELGNFLTRMQTQGYMNERDVEEFKAKFPAWMRVLGAGVARIGGAAVSGAVGGAAYRLLAP